MKTVLAIGGSDSSGGAGIQADIKTISANGVYAMSVVTAVTAQNTKGIFGIYDIYPEAIENQINVIFDDIEVNAIKIGMVSKIESIKAINRGLINVKKLPPIVIDPVIKSSSGFRLLAEHAKRTLIRELFPLATIITPNLSEVEGILGCNVNSIEEMKVACAKLKELGPKYVLVKCGELYEDATDVLYDGENFIYLTEDRINAKHTHGTGCTLSSAIAANLAKGMKMEEAVMQGKRYVTVAINHGFKLGNGLWPTNHFCELYNKANLKIK
ncbi:bifunctional hydroxymethylpyrimidine kinase/phosphomethylpyrimidine kinase [Clostridium sp. SHJSY1]|uniref:bifunctional hydroxymethylpyrimidine kinase/phosphomethylpyrimidine kinase n=1 Tax=Clostridium sp. SHJSY1 TaxID=2942483 RepID=UPI002876D12B|nr:bifunctional hydroxymethylpyrimidine kinase/phosphomethylpyrimidine kinase [Clostridium sp. SHJSY1]MDS0526905.1 bifunctional hydroxymethylpyrimidine kinase/phosphomethylpyrimidine kinase [Clostridium sp. SHJSY1]